VIVALQHDHGNWDARTNAGMKYLVHTLGIEKLSKLVESYCGKEIALWRPIKEWKYNDWLGW
jgi:sulfite reductase beta subunit-like hemoprotein